MGNTLLEPAACSCCKGSPLEPLRDGVWVCSVCDCYPAILEERPDDDDD
jgi:ribosomal protein L37AE/L43A